ncbi:DTX46 [Symbiodinium natans]|uniref:DTX46 protein n=1 Tax=Symbiodinium natans TaxID=878477 RepID=A0A812NI97_9DINO|nr:DTX46 [Symbiodinium natans]
MQSGDVRTASQTLRLLLKLGASGAVATAGLLFLVASKGGLRLFSADPAVLSAVPLVSLSCCILLTPFAFCMEGAHIAAQRQQWLSRRLCLLTSFVGLTYRFAMPADAGLAQVWAVFAAYLLARGIWYAWGLWGPRGVLTKPQPAVES